MKKAITLVSIHHVRSSVEIKCWWWKQSPSCKVCQPVFTFVCYRVSKSKVRLLIIHCNCHTYSSVMSRGNRVRKMSIYLHEYAMKRIAVRLLHFDILKKYELITSHDIDAWACPQRSMVDHNKQGCMMKTLLSQHSSQGNKICTEMYRRCCLLCLASCCFFTPKQATAVTCYDKGGVDSGNSLIQRHIISIHVSTRGHFGPTVVLPCWGGPT